MSNRQHSAPRAENPSGTETTQLHEDELEELQQAAEEDSRNEHLRPRARALQLADDILELPLSNADAIALAQVYATVHLADTLRSRK